MTTSFWRALKRVLVGAFAVPLAVVLLGLLLIMFFGPPIALVAESIDLARMRSTAVGKVEEVTIERGSKGTSRARIRYSFAVGGRPFQSDRYLPGFLANHGTWTGGGAIAKDYPVGKRINVFYDPDRPGRAAIEYGWFKGSVGFTAILWGMVVYGLAQRGRCPTRGRHLVGLAGLASSVYGLALLFLGPQAVRAADLPWHTLAWCAVLAGVALYYHGKRSRAAPRPDARVTE